MDKIISDWGPQFAAKSFKELLKLLKIKSALTTAYHPQSDGATERFNQEIKAYISIFCMNNPKEWSNMLTTMEFTHNNWQHTDWQNTPFEFILGITLMAIPLSFENTKYPTIKERMKKMIQEREEALAAHKLARSRMAGRKWDTFISFKKGQKVWLDSQNLKTSYHKKIRLEHEGPFKIEEVLGPVTYQLKLPPTWRIHNTFHAILLWPYTETEAHKQFSSTNTWAYGRRRSLQCGTDIKTLKKRLWLLVLCFVGRLLNYWSIVGTGIGIFHQWWHTDRL